MGNLITNDARCTCKTKCSIAMIKAALNNKQAVLTGILELHVRKRPVKCCIWSVALCGAETVWSVALCGAETVWSVALCGAETVCSVALCGAETVWECSFVWC